MRIQRICSVLAVVAACTAAAQESPVLSLEECLAIALSDNPTVKVADMEVTRTDYSRRETLGRLFPSIDFSAAYQRTLRKQVAYMNMDAFAGMGGGSNDSETPTSPASASAASAPSRDTGIKMGLDNMYNVGLQASLPIVAPQLWQSIKISDLQIVNALEQARASRLDLINQVKNAYYGLQLAEDSRRVVQASYDMAQLTHTTYQKRFELGDASEFDVLRTSVALGNIEPQLIQCDIAVRRARLGLAVLMGLDAEFEFDVTGTLADYPESMYTDADALTVDLSSNTSLAQNAINTQTLERTVALNKAAWYPTLALTGNMNWISSSNGSPLKNFRWNPYSVVGVAVSMPIFQGGQRHYKIRQAELQLEEMAYVRENLTSALSAQASVAIDNIRLNIKQIASSARSVSQAERAHSIQQQSFDIGASSYIDLRDSELALTQARLGYYQAIYNYLVAQSDLQLLLGNAPIDQYTVSSETQKQ